MNQDKAYRIVIEFLKEQQKKGNINDDTPITFGFILSLVAFVQKSPK